MIVSSIKDQDNNETSYSYNNNTGTLNSFTDDSGITSYTYNANNDQITSISKTDSYNRQYTIAYSYNTQLHTPIQRMILNLIQLHTTGQIIILNIINLVIKPILLLVINRWQAIHITLITEH